MADRKVSQFEDRYKTKSKSTIDPRALRSHRRSVERKQKRDGTFNQTRQLQSVTEEDRDQGVSSPFTDKPKATTSAKPKANQALSRREMLEKWKAEKALKKKLSAKDQGKKVMFKVVHTAKDLLDFSKPITKLSNVPVAPSGKTAPTKATEGPSTRTRSRATRVSAPAAPKLALTKKKSPVKKAATRLVKPAVTKPVATKPTRSTRRSTKTSAPVKLAAKRENSDIARSKNINNCRGGTSFAPEDYKFSAPDHLKPFDFKPMSPTIVTSFFSINPTDSPASRRCSTPINAKIAAHSKTPNLPSIAQVLTSSSDSDGAASGTDRRRTRRSVRVSDTESVTWSSSSSEGLLCKDDFVKKAVVKESDHEASPKRKAGTQSRRITRRSVTKEEVVTEKPVLEEEEEELPVRVKSDTEAQLPTVFEEGEADAFVFKTPIQSATQRRQRRMTSADRLSSKRKKTPLSTRCSLILRTLSPEEGVEILKNSPMIEMNRRKSKTPVLKLAEVSKQEEDENEDVMQQLLRKFSENDQSQSAPAPVEAKPVEKDDLVKPTSLVDVSHFRDLIKTETGRLCVLCDQWNQFNDADLSEEICGQIRTTVGQAQLLMDQRFKQFNSLVDNCEFGLGEKETTTTDLTGFWEMVYFQVEDVNVKFDDLVKLQAAGWKKAEPVKKKIIKKKPVAAATKATAAKSKFSAFRAKMLAQKKEVLPVEEVKKPESPKVEATAAVVEADPSDTKTFDAGFFFISSPVRTPSSQPSSTGPTPKATLQKSLVKPRRSTPVGGSPFLRAVLNSSLRRSLSKRSNDASLFTDPVAPPSETPKRTLSEVNEACEERSIDAKGTPRRSARRSVRLSQLPKVSPEKGDDFMARYLVPTEHKENALTPVNQLAKDDDSLFKDSPVFAETPRTYARKRGASLISTPAASPAKKSKTASVADLICFSPVCSPAPTPKDIV